MKIQRIIVRMPNWLGDAVMATPILQDLRVAFPKAQITAMIEDKIAALLQSDPRIDELFFFSRPKGFLRRKEGCDIVDQIRKGNYDLGLLLTNSFSSAWWFFRADIKMRLGFTGDFRRFLLTHPIPPPKAIQQQHLVDTYKMLLAPLGIAHSASKPQLFITDDEKTQARKTLKDLGLKNGMQLIGMNPGAAYGPAKCWPAESFRSLAKRLCDENPSLFLVFFGDAKSALIVKEITRNLPPRVCNLAGLTSLRELMALIALCDLFLTNDSGPMHIAAALQTPLLALFGSTSEIITGPYQFGKVIHKHVPCSPCFKRICPIDFRCMTRISVDEVYKAIEEMLP